MADITLTTGTINANGCHTLRSLVFVSASVGYWFFVDGDNDFKYQKTTDGGQTWGSVTTIYTGTVIAADVWFDQWTPGDTGTVIHTWWIETGSHDVHYRSLDTNGNTLGTDIQVFNGASAVANYGSTVSGTKARGGNLLCVFDIDVGTERGTYRSTDSGATWGARTNMMEATSDFAVLFPGNETDNQDIWALYNDASANELTLKVHDDSADTNSESSALATYTEFTNDTNGQYGFTGMVRHSDGHLIIVYVQGFPSASGDTKVYDINGTGSITAKTNIFTAWNKMYYPQIFINQSNNDLYVFYGGKSDGSETVGSNGKYYWVKSTDGGATWGTLDNAYSVTAGGKQAWSSMMGDRAILAWRNGSACYVNYDNSFTFSSAFTASVAATIGGVTASLTSTFTKPSYTGTITPTIAHATAALSATFTAADSTYTASIGATTQPTSGSLSANFTQPTYTAAISATIAQGIPHSLIANLTATFTPTVFTASIAANVGNWSGMSMTTDHPVTASLSSTFIQLTYAGTINTNTGQTTASLSSTFVKPIYTGNISASVSITTANLLSAFTEPIYTSVVSGSVPPTTASLLSTFVEPSYTSSISAIISPTTSSLSATFVKPTYASTVSAVVSPITAQLLATFSKPVYIGTIGAVSSPTTAQLSSTLSEPTYTSAIHGQTAPVQASLSVLFSKPIYTAAINAQAPAATANLNTVVSVPSIPSAWFYFSYLASAN